MRIKLTILSMAAAAIVASGSAMAQPYTAETAVRIEAIPVQSLTVSDANFLTGSRYGAPATIAGVLRVAPGQGPRPTVVILAGSSGFGAPYEEWSDQLLAMGISTFFLDSYAGRGIVSTSADQSQIPVLTQILDLFSALDILRNHPNVDASRIVVMGYSRGAIVSLYGAMNRFHELWNRSGVEPVAYVSWYAPCWTSYIGGTDFVDVPVRLFHGTDDDVTPIAPCRDYVDRLQAAGEDVELAEFAGAHHAFNARNLPVDSPLFLPRPVFQGLGTCLFREDTVGDVVNVATGVAFDWADECFAGGHLAYAPDAADQARQEVIQLLREVLDLE